MGGQIIFKVTTVISIMRWLQFSLFAVVMHDDASIGTEDFKAFKL